MQIVLLLDLFHFEKGLYIIFICETPMSKCKIINIELLLIKLAEEI